MIYCATDNFFKVIISAAYNRRASPYHHRPVLVDLPACHYRHLLGWVCEHDDVDDTDVAPCRPVVGLVHPRHHLVLPAVCCKNALVGRIDGSIAEDHDAVTAGHCSGLPLQHSVVLRRLRPAGCVVGLGRDALVVPSSSASSMACGVVGHLDCTGFLPLWEP